jgi:hypothetical protein
MHHVFHVCVFVNLVTQHAKCMHCIILTSVACLALQFFPHCLIKGTLFEKKLLNTKCVFCFSVQILSETFLILNMIQQVIIIHVHTSLHLYIIPLFLPDFNET